MLDKNIVKYNIMNDIKASGRQVGGRWQSEFTVTGTSEKEVLAKYEFMITELNKINNKYNVDKKETKKKTPIKLETKNKVNVKM